MKQRKQSGIFAAYVTPSATAIHPPTFYAWLHLVGYVFLGHRVNGVLCKHASVYIDLLVCVMPAESDQQWRNSPYPL